MRFSIFAALSAAALVAAVPNPVAQSDSLKPSCFDKCIGGLACIQSWPASCHCANGHKIKCAEQCKVPVPKLQDCGDDIVVPLPTPIKPAQCYKECVASYACIQVYPQSCYCENGIRVDCGSKCGVKVEVKECPPLDATLLA